jgi:hypothetical protein
MKLGIMQPYFLPYIGYYQLVEAVDCFVVYDNIKYTKKGWINRNRLLLDGIDRMFTIPLHSASDRLDVVERQISHEFDRGKLLNRFREAYGRAPHFSTVWPLIERVVANPETALFGFIFESIRAVCSSLHIETRLVRSSSIAIDHSLRGKDKVLALCDALGATHYINSVGGAELYSRDEFAGRGVALSFLKPDAIEYPQFDHAFVPWLSIADVLMFNGFDRTRALLRNWTAQ